MFQIVNKKIEKVSIKHLTINKTLVIMSTVNKKIDYHKTGGRKAGRKEKP